MPGSDRDTGDGSRRQTSPKGKPMPMLLWFLAVNALMGVAMGVAFASFIVLSDVAGIKTMLEASSEPIIPLILFYASCALTFGSLNMGVAVMSLPLEKPPADDR